MSKILFVTGTDTGVGKTLLTVALLVAWRRRGIRVLAMKPFCSGGWEDVERIQQAQGRLPPRRALTPYYFPEPLAPLLGARRQRRRIRLPEVKQAIAKMAGQCDWLIVEGAGGVLVPLGESFSVADLVGELGCDVALVAPNKLGVISHTRLAVEALRTRGVSRVVVVLMEQRRQDLSARTNAKLLRELLPEDQVVMFPFLGLGMGRVGRLERNLRKFEKVLAWFGEPDSFCPRSSWAARKSAGTKRLKRRKKDR